ncbi:ComEC family competence protein [Kluyvera intermedia]|nr:ComEC family competence protein [Kluyvera intermedia]
MRLPQLASCTLLGILPLSVLPELPSLTFIKFAVIALVLLAVCGKAGRVISLTGLMFCWGGAGCLAG